MRAALPFVLLAVFAAAPRPARADVGPESEWYFLAGVNLGTVVEDAVAEFMLGAEISAARLFRRGAWYGAYADTLRDFRRDATRLSAGVEAGYRVAGIDLGPVVELGDETRTGLRVRAVLTGAWVTLYGGPVIRLGDIGDDQRLTGEVGLLIKVPLPLQGGRLSPVR